MASAHMRGAARIEYTPPGVGQPQVTHLLAWPLRELEPVDEASVWEWWSADLTSREIVRVGGGVRSLWATIRMDDQPSALKALLRAGLWGGVTMTYRLAASGTPYPFLIAATASGGVAIQPDRARHVRGEYEVRILMRRVDGGSFDALLTGGGA